MRTRIHKKKGISAVNVTGLMVAVALFVYSLSLISPSLLGTVGSRLAAVSVSVNAGVAPNSDNTLARQLQEKSTQLDVQQQHIQVLQQSLGSSNDRLAFFSLLASGLLLLLVGANFYFDWRRSRGMGGTFAKSLSVDLRTPWLK